jgi:hypothetical protein
MANRRNIEEAAGVEEETRVMTSGDMPRDPGTGEVLVDGDAQALNRRALAFEGEEPGATRTLDQVEGSDATIQMVKDGNTLAVNIRDVESHRKMGWGFAR